MARDEFKFKLSRMAYADYSALIAQEKCFHPETICFEVKLCPKRRREAECPHNFVILTLGPTETEIGRYQFTCNGSGDILGMKRLYAQIFKPIEFRGIEKLNK